MLHKGRIGTPMQQCSALRRAFAFHVKRHLPRIGPAVRAATGYPRLDETRPPRRQLPASLWLTRPFVDPRALVGCCAEVDAKETPWRAAVVAWGRSSPLQPTGS